MDLTPHHRVFARDRYWQIEQLRQWAPQSGAELVAFGSAIAEAAEPLQLCVTVVLPGDPSLALPDRTEYQCQPITGYLYPEGKQPEIATESQPLVGGTAIALILDNGILYQWRLAKMD